MRPHPRVIGFLMRGLEHELNTVQQYQTRATLADLWGEDSLADYFRHEIAEEQAHAERLTRQLLLMGVAPNGMSIDPVRPGRNAEEMLALSAEHERRAIHLYDEARRFCERVRDAENHALFTELLQDELSHLQQLNGTGSSTAAG